MGNNTEGLSSQALQQGGIGMLLTVVIITMPTVAAALWQGSMSSFMHFSAFGGGGASSPGPQGQPAGSYIPHQRGNDGPRNNDQTEMRDLSAVRTSGVSGSTPALAAPGSRGAANATDNSRVV